VVRSPVVKIVPSKGPPVVAATCFVNVVCAIRVGILDGSGIDFEAESVHAFHIGPAGVVVVKEVHGH